jgi:BioD-like phosphotransacetylase family protein
MKALFVTSIEPYSGKTAVCLALGKRLQTDGHKVGYLKPVSTQPWRTPQGKLADEDAAFVQSALGLGTDPSGLSPVIVTPEMLSKLLTEKKKPDHQKMIKDAASTAVKGMDLLLLEGNECLRRGYSLGISDTQVAELLGALVLVVIRYRGALPLIDDAVAAKFRLGEQLLGVILNHIPEQERSFVDQEARPYLEKQGVRVLGALPRVPQLSALSVGELKERLGGEVLTESFNPDALVETFTVGAMTADAALSRFRRTKNKAVITGGDRTDIQLAALETPTELLILTGNLQPSPLIIQQADTLNVPILLVKDNTMETVEIVERAYGKTRLGQPEKLEIFMELMARHVDIAAIYAALELS